MPYVKPLAPQPWAKMHRLLTGYGLTGPKLAEILGVSRPTARSRLDEPGRLTLEDLDRISRHGHIPWNELLDAARR